MREQTVLEQFLDQRNEAARELIQEAAVLVDVAGGERILTRGQFPGRLILIASGLFRAELYDRHGKPIELATFEPGALVGEMSFLSGEAVANDVVAETDGRVWYIEQAALTAAAEVDDNVIRDLAMLLASRVRATNQRLRQSRVGRVAYLQARPRAVEMGVAYRVALAAASQNRAPVLLVDLAQPDPPPLPDGQVFDGLAALPSDRTAIRELEQFAAAAGPTVAHLSTRGEAISVEALAVLIRQLRRRFSTIIVLSDPEDRRMETLADDTDVTLKLILEGEAVTASDRCIVLVESSKTPWQRDVKAAERAHGCTVSAIVPGPTSDYRPERFREALGSAAQAEVDRVARIVIGRTVGLALGAGGAKGYAHIGAAAALEEMGVPFDFIAGASVAAPLAGAISEDLSYEVMRQAMDTILNKAASLTLPYRSLLSTRGLESGLREFTGDKTFEDARIPLAIIACDIERRETVTFTEGRVHEPMLASAAIPILFPPVVINGRPLVDGGVLQPIPIRQVAELGADIVIAVKLNDPVEDVGARRGGRFRIPTLPVIRTVLRTIAAQQWQIFSEGATQADITVEPSFEGPTGLSDWSRGPYFTQCGADAVEAVREQIEMQLPWVRPD